MKDRARVRIKWSVIEESGGARHVTECLGLGVVSVLVLSAYLFCCACAILSLDGPPNFGGVVAGLFLTTPCKGLFLGQWIRRVHSRGHGIVHPFFTRLGLWIGFFIVVGICGRLAVGLPAAWSTLHRNEAYFAIVVLGLLAFGALQFQVMLRMPEIRRSADAEDGAIL